MNHRSGSGSRRTPRGFTRIEAITLVLAVTLLGAIQLPLRGDARRVSRASVCLAGLRQLQLGWSLYAADHDGRIVAGYETSGSPPSGPDWTAGSWLDFVGGNPVNTDPARFPGRSPLLPYAGSDPMTYRCPSDPARVLARVGNSGRSRPTPRTRSRSLNSWLGGPGWVASAPWRYATSIQQLTDPGPAETFSFIDEREDSINDGALMIDMSGFPTLHDGNHTPSQLRMIDYPAYWHRGGAGVAFTDGHVDVKKWVDPRTTPKPRPGSFLALNVPSPFNVDVTWMQNHTCRINP